MKLLLALATCVLALATAATAYAISKASPRLPEPARSEPAWRVWA